MTSESISHSTLAFPVEQVSKSTAQGIAELPSESSAHSRQPCSEPERPGSRGHGLSLLPFRLCKDGDLKPSFNAANGCFCGLKIKHENPHNSYRPLFSLGRSGNLVMAFSRTNPFRQPLPVKKTSVPQAFDTRRGLVQPCHPKIVRVMEVFHHGSSLFTVYEKMEVSLEQMIALPAQLEEHQVATICAEVLKGLDFIHEELGIKHGSLSAANILFSAYGIIKIGNIIEALMYNQREDLTSDIQALRQIAGGLRERWSDGAAAFFVVMEEKSCAELLMSDFVKKSRGHRSLIDQVQMALVATSKTWSICEHFEVDNKSNNAW